MGVTYRVEHFTGKHSKRARKMLLDAVAKESLGLSGSVFSDTGRLALCTVA